MKLKIITSLVSLSIVSASALTIDEAVYSALFKNQDLLVTSLQNTQKKENKNIQEAEFLPKLDLNYSYNSRNKAQSGQDKEDSTALAKISYNLFNGFKNINDLKNSQNEEKSFALLLEAKKADISLEIKSAYITYLNNQQHLNTYISAYSLFEKQYEDSNNRYKQGLLAKNDLLKIQINMLDSKQNVIKAKADLKISKEKLGNLMGGVNLDNEKIEDLKASSQLNKTYAVESIYNRSEIKSMNYDILALKNALISSKSSYYPKVDASYSINKYGDDFSPSGNNSSLSSQNISNISASWNLYNGGSNKSEIKISKLKINEKKLQLEKLKLDIKLQFNKALSNLQVEKQNLEIATLSLQQAKINYEIVSNRFSEGVSSTTDLIDANYLLSQAKQRYFSSFYSKFLAYASLDRITQK